MGIDDIPRQLRHALAAALAFAGAEAVLLLAIPATLVAAIEGVLPAGDLDLLPVLALVAGVALSAACALRAGRRRILLRSSLWLEHVLAGRCRAAEASRRCATIVSRMVAGRTAAALTEAPWVVVPLAALALVRPLLALATLAGVAAALAIASVTALLSGARLAEAAGIAASIHETAGTRLVARYIGESRIGTAEALGVAIAGLAVAVTGMLALGLVVHGAMTVGAALAGLVLSGWTLALAVRTVPALPLMVLAARAWRALRDDASMQLESEEAAPLSSADPVSGTVPVAVPSVRQPAAPAMLH